MLTNSEKIGSGMFRHVPLRVLTRDGLRVREAVVSMGGRPAYSACGAGFLWFKWVADLDRVRILHDWLIEEMEYGRLPRCGLSLEECEVFIEGKENCKRFGVVPGRHKCLRIRFTWEV